MRGRAVTNGRDSYIQLKLEFDGPRAFIIWDSILIGQCQLKARLEIDPKLLKPGKQTGCDYLYDGQLVLPNPEHN
jgi:hypothetical protein